MEIKTETVNNGRLISLDGKLDTTTSASFSDVLLKGMEEDPLNVIIDMAALKYISSSGLRVLLAGLKKMKAHNKRMILACLQPHVMEVMDIAGFSPLFTITPSREEAILLLQKKASA
jgi:anti-sigma B factor antagonist